jgi:hypothetical protein
MAQWTNDLSYKVLFLKKLDRVALFETAKELKDMGMGQGLIRHLPVRAA